MFTGRIATVGAVDRIAGPTIWVRAPECAEALGVGGSVCVDGVRLTVQDVADGGFRAAVTGETRTRSTFDDLSEGRAVNVEPPLTAGAALDGHLVQGYVDAVGKVTRVDDEDGCWRVWIRPPERVLAHLVPKGPIAVDGVSVAVAEVLRDRFSIVLLPMTRKLTTLDECAAGDRLNLEIDLVTRLVASRGAADVGRITGTLPWAGEVGGQVGVDKVVRQIAAGGGVVVWDPATESEADVVVGGARLKADTFRFLVTQVWGMPQACCLPEVLDRLEIPPIAGSGDKHGTAFCVPVDLAANPGTGVSAAERAATIRAMADPGSRPADFLRPGHVSPLRARTGLLAERQGHTEATVALCTAAGLPPVGVCCEIMSPDGTMAGAADAEAVALRWALPMIDIGELVQWL